MTDCQHETDAICGIMLELGTAVENRMNGLSPFITFALLRDVCLSSGRLARMCDCL